MAHADPSSGTGTVEKLPSERWYGKLIIAHTTLVFVQLTYATSSTFLKVALNTGVNPLVFALYRNLLSAVVLFPFAYIAERTKRTPLTVPITGLMLACAFIRCFAGVLLYYAGLSLAGLSLAGCVPVSIPVFTFIISVLVGQERLHWRTCDGQAKILGISLAVCGGAMISTVSGPGIVGRVPMSGLANPIRETLAGVPLSIKFERWQLGVIFLLLSATCSGGNLNLQVPTLSRYPAPVSLTAFSCFYGGIMLALPSLLVYRDLHSWMILDRNAVVTALLLSGGIVSINLSLQSWACKAVGPLLVAFYSPLQLFATELLAHFYLGETLFLGSIIGAALTCSSLYILTWAKSQRRDYLQDDRSPALSRDEVIPQRTHSLREPLLR